MMKRAEKEKMDRWVREMTGMKGKGRVEKG